MRRRALPTLRWVCSSGQALRAALQSIDVECCACARRDLMRTAPARPRPGGVHCTTACGPHRCGGDERAVLALASVAFCAHVAWHFVACCMRRNARCVLRAACCLLHRWCRRYAPAGMGRLAADADSETGDSAPPPLPPLPPLPPPPPQTARAPRHSSSGIGLCRHTGLGRYETTALAVRAMRCKLEALQVSGGAPACSRVGLKPGVDRCSCSHARQWKGDD